MTISVLILSYNHVDWIHQSIMSVVKQKTCHDLEIIICDDCSTDGTQEIINKVALKYPCFIHPIYRNKNIGVHNNILDGLRQCQGKYIAFLEGDDFWCDETKLDKQVQIMEGDSGISITMHRSRIIYLDSNKERINGRDIISEGFGDIDIVYGKQNFQSGSFVFRKDKLLLPKEFNQFIFPDTAILLTLLSNGTAYAFKDIMSTYRKHGGGMSQICSINKYRNWLNMLSLASDIFGKQFHKAIRLRVVLKLLDSIALSKSIPGRSKYLYSILTLSIRKFPNILFERQVYNFFLATLKVKYVDSCRY